MTTLFAKTALLPDGWADNVLIEYDKDGWIVGVDTFKPDIPSEGAADGSVDVVTGPLIPGMCNVHSHAFQRAMAGLTERGSGKKDNFWSWRDTMYRFLAQIDPEDMEALAAHVYVEMLKAGYTTVGEFHYVHHQPDGTPYDDIDIMSQQIIKGAFESGIAITHLPTLYAYAGFKEEPPADGQKRFLNDVPRLLRIMEELYGTYKDIPQVTIGFAHHSLRAVSPDMLAEGTEAVRRLFPNAPIHIHAAEQMQEVEACIEWSNRRPVEWLLENGTVDDKWCFIHCTHVTEAEIEGLAASGVVAGLCPTTEANLGDGIFPLVKYFNANGHFAIGSDSNVGLNPFEELRWLEYTQRLLFKERTLIQKQELPSVGAALFERASRGGAHALGRKAGRIEIGHRADFVVLDDAMPVMAGKVRDHILDTAVFACQDNPVKDVMVGGRWVIQNRHHKREESIQKRYLKVVEKIS